jgi:CobQ-like glutamine amidotransferase family enzyme
MKKMSLTIAWLYPDLMSTYGDRGNIITLQKRCEWRNINTAVRQLSVGSTLKELSSCDILFMGGGEDRQQKIVAGDMKNGKAEILRKMIEKNIPGLYICGAYQFLGKYYKEADGTIIDGLNILDLYTENPGSSVPRLIGNVAANVQLEGLQASIVGFENHGGRTYLGNKVKPLGNIIKGFGNNGEDGLEGAMYRTSIGTYFHGPILPKNPQIADWLIAKALEKKYKEKILLQELDDTLEKNAHNAIARRLKIEL